MTTKTIQIEKKNKDTGKVTKITYAKVTARVAEFHKANKNCSIKTEIEFKEGWVLSKATVTPEVTKPERFFTGTSLGKAGAEKALEKLETIAVGRALAFAGFLSDGEIASSEEMAKYEEPLIVDSLKALSKLRETKNLEELKKVWISLSQAERDDKEVKSLKATLKEQYADSPSGTEVK